MILAYHTIQARTIRDFVLPVVLTFIEAHIMHQYQVTVETKDKRLFATEWVTGHDSAVALVLLIASRFEEPTYRIGVSHRVLDITAQEWGDFVVSEASGN